MRPVCVLLGGNTCNRCLRRRAQATAHCLHCSGGYPTQMSPTRAAVPSHRGLRAPRWSMVHLRCTGPATTSTPGRMRSLRTRSGVPATRGSPREWGILNGCCWPMRISRRARGADAASQPPLSVEIATSWRPEPRPRCPPPQARHPQRTDPAGRRRAPATASPR